MEYVCSAARCGGRGIVDRSVCVGEVGWVGSDGCRLWCCVIVEEHRPVCDDAVCEEGGSGRRRW